jgi:hypothetical protein
LSFIIHHRDDPNGAPHPIGSEARLRQVTAEAPRPFYYPLSAEKKMGTRGFPGCE